MITINQDKTFKALNKLTIKNINISGSKGSKNGKITFAAKEVEISNITFDPETNVYNTFEGYQVLTDKNYIGVEKVTFTNTTVSSPSLTHNVVNVYTPASDAVITVKDCDFNLNVNNSNVLRLANYMNSENVTVNFENVNWTYEEAATETSDWSWAGLVIFQPAGKDVALSGDNSKISTWKFNFKNCKYNGVKVNANNFGEHNQVVYGYNLGGSKAVSDFSEIATITFE